MTAQKPAGIETGGRPERWLPVVGFEGFLEVSDQGRVRSLDRDTHIPATHRSLAYTRRHKGKVLKQAIHPRGYRYITIAGGGTIRPNTKVHHLVLEAFVGPCPDGMECCHRNDIAGDNRLENLRWDTKGANMQDSVALGRRKRTHCKRGHEFTPENIIALTNPHSARRCKICTRAYSKKVRNS